MTGHVLAMAPPHHHCPANAVEAKYVLQHWSATIVAAFQQTTPHKQRTRM
jgi:hypothetical protein